MDSFKKCIAEFIGTFTLVLVGCGTAMLVGCDSASGCGYILTAFAFGLVIVGMAYCVGNVSGCHINPAVSLAVLISGRMSVTDFFLYLVSQILGAISGAACLKIIFSLGKVTDKTGGLGSNGLAGVSDNPVAGLIVEILLTFIFVLVILGVTDSKFSHGSFGGVVIGFSLVMVHILGIGLTGTSVNPARSIGPAIFAGGAALSSLWVFIVGPFVGAALAAVIYKVMAKKD
ncbi:MAG: MIP family channel protein [Saccharofermentans sp.]|jgi:aquaporin Z|nr:MIP family channel protein [Saccharofermentans sp.]